MSLVGMMQHWGASKDRIFVKLEKMRKKEKVRVND